VLLNFSKAVVKSAVGYQDILPSWPCAFPFHLFVYDT
jgi:hypothetical protein